MSGKIRPEDIDEVRSRVSLPDVAAEFMQVRKAGRLFKALCPFHKEKSPSFSIDPAKGLYYCFGCSKGGNVFNLLMELEGLSFAEAVERLARRAGVDLRYESMTPADRKAATHRERLHDAHRAAIDFYHETLMGPDGAEARDYLKGRGFTKATVEEFQIGAGPSARDGLAKHLRAKGFSEAELTDAGLVIRTESGPLVDRFRGRLMFPIHDLTGKPVGFGARRLSDRGDGPKYLNSAESPIYKKTGVLYALNRAKAPIVKAERAIVVEGYTDVIALHQAGVAEVVATCGTALGADHFRLVARFTQRAVLAFDSDDAGQAAAERAFEHAQEAGIDARVLVMPEGDDPADFVSKNGGDAFRARADGAQALIEFRLRREVARFAIAEPEQRSRALKSALPILAGVQDSVVQTEYARRLSQWLRVDVDEVFLALDRARRTGRVDRAAAPKRLSAQLRCERDAVKIVLQFPKQAEPYLRTTSPDDFTNGILRSIFEEVSKGTDQDVLAESLTDPRARNAVASLSMDPLDGVDAEQHELPDRLAEEIFNRLKEFALVRQIQDLKARLQRLNPEAHPDDYNEMFRELVALEGQKRRVSMVLQGGAE